MKKQIIKHAIITAVLFFMVGATMRVTAQQVPLFNQYYNIKSLVYTSTNAFEQNRQISFVFRDQFGGLIGSPRNFALAYTGSVRNKMGLNANVTSADIGFISQTKLSAGGGYKLFGEGSNGLSLGTQVGLSLFSLNEDRVNPENPADNVIIDLLGSNGSSVSLDLSLSYRVSQFSLDLAVPNIINESLSDDAYIQINDDNIPDFIVGASYAIELGPEATLTPNVTLRQRETIGSEVDFLTRLDLKDKFYISGGYRANYGVTGGVGIKLFPKLLFTYHYDFGQSDVPFLADGFNEFGLHLRLNDKEEREDECISGGEAVVNKIIDEKIFDENLVSAEDRSLALCYLSSLEEGKRKEKNLKGEEAYQALFAKVKADELARQEAVRQAKLEQERQDEEKRKAEAAEKERERLAEIERLELQERQRLAQQKKEEIDKVLSLATRSVAFNSGSATLKTESYESLNAVAQLLEDNPEVKLVLSGYTDNTGNADNNLMLSKQRAAAVKTYLIGQGGSEGRITAEGFGIARPLADNATAEGRAINRRVEMKIVQ
ncbi:MAG: PorP/SprF family type IX secretion system membrane protein [Roseivirga sp.]|nr:PorP/SprF family type IX secretion system membrane protein [Roseivirga sp.]